MLSRPPTEDKDKGWCAEQRRQVRIRLPRMAEVGLHFLLRPTPLGYAKGGRPFRGCGEEQVDNDASRAGKLAATTLDHFLYPSDSYHNDLADF